MADFVPLFGRNRVSSKKVEAVFGGGSLTSDGGVLHLRAVDNTIGLIDRLCSCISDGIDDVAHGTQQLSLFNGHYDEHCLLW